MESRLPFWKVFIFKILLCHFVHTLDCPRKIYVELGKDGVINCRILNDGDVYWYKGNSTKTSPIVRLENGQTEISPGSSPYDIGEEGSLIIKNIEQGHYGVYSVVNFYDVDNHYTDQIEVEMAVKPQTPCPLITGCNDCNHCFLTEPKMGKISCSITGIRPPVYLSIVSESENNLQLVLNVSKESYDPVTDTWNTTTTIEYSEWSDCASPIQLRCVAGKHQVQLLDSVANATSDSCKPTTQISGYLTPSLNGTNRWIIFGSIVIVGAICVLFGFVLLILVRRKKGLCRSRNDMKREEEMTPFVDEKDDRDKDFLQSLNVNLLAEYASPHNFKNLLEEFCSVSSEALFNGNVLSLNKRNSFVSNISGEDLIRMLLKEAGQYSFITDNDFTKKLFTQYLGSCLSKKIAEGRTVLYLNLDGLHRNMSIANAVVQKLKKGNEFSVDDIQKVVCKQRCLILLDRIDGLISQEKQGPRCAKELTPTIGELLSERQDVFNTFPRLGCLLFVESMNDLPSTYASSYTVKIHLDHEHLNLYIESVVQYYSKLQTVHDAGQSGPPTDEGHNHETNDDFTKSSKNRKEQTAKMVTRKLLEVTSVTKAPLQNDQIWLIIFIHAIISNVLQISEGELFNLFFCRRSGVAKRFLNFLKMQYSCKRIEQTTFEALERKLGKISLETELQNPNFDNNSSLLSVYQEEEIKRLIEPDEFEAAVSCGLLHAKQDDRHAVRADESTCSSSAKIVVFCHDIVQEYLAAQVIATKKEIFEHFFKSFCWQTDERMERVLQMMFATGIEARNKWLRSFVEEKNWNIFVDCLLESGTAGDSETLLKDILSKEGNYSFSFDKLGDYFHRLVVLQFCSRLVNHHIVPVLLSFSGNCPVDFFHQLRAPKVRFLLIKEMNFQNEGDFIQLLDAVQEKELTSSLQFMKCLCPTQFSKDELQRLVRRQGFPKLPEILQTDIIKNSPADPHRSGDGWKKLDLESGSWI